MHPQGLGIVALVAMCALAGCRPAADTPLNTAARRGETAEIERLVTEGADIDSTASSRGLTPLMIAARDGRVDSVQALLRLGANAEAIDRGSTGWTALIQAIHTYQPGAVRALLNGGADPDHAVDEHRITPLMMAAGYGYADIVDLLLAHGADPRKKSAGGYTALVAAVRGVPDFDRFTVGRCQTATVKALLKAAPDMLLPDNGMGKTARWAAWLGNCQEVMRLLAASPQGR